MRIYVGGVGPTVTPTDVENTFSSLGRVAGVELVRTNGRSFAYMDFEPHSEKALAKLFSTYNGCTWKGGKLKLERAKEHYLDRLKREWEEDAKAMSETSADLKIEKGATDSKLERLNLDNMQLRIFFPNLRKVKSLPFKGTGKHKYSFQRIEVPPLPIHFCDCEEHWEQSETASQKYLSSLNSGIHYEKELSIMNSVMNKLFANENIGEPANEEKTTDIAENASDASINDILEEESEEILDMDDNLVTNIGVGRSDDMLLLLGRDILAANQVAARSKQQPSENELSWNTQNSKKRQDAGPEGTFETTANKKACSGLAANITADEFTVMVPQTASSDGHSEEPDISNQPPVNKGHFSLPKSSWKDLVAEAKRSSFSLTNVWPGTSSLPSAVPRSADLAADKLTADLAADKLTVEKKTKSRRDGKKVKALPIMRGLPLEKEDGREGQEVGASDASEIAANAEPCSEKNIENDLSSMLPLNASSEDHSREPEGSAEPLHPQRQTEPSTIASQSTKGQSWLQKSSWKDLVGGMGSGSFSITNIFPGIGSLQSTQPKSNDTATGTSTEVKKIKPQADTKISKALPVADDLSLGKASGSGISRTSPAMQDLQLPKALGDDEMRAKGSDVQAHAGGDEHKEPQKAVHQEAGKMGPEVSTNRECTFMRSEESMKQWSQAKAALSRRLNKKRKNIEDDSVQPRNMRQKMR